MSDSRLLRNINNVASDVSDVLASPDCNNINKAYAILDLISQPENTVIFMAYRRFLETVKCKIEEIEQEYPDDWRYLDLYREQIRNNIFDCTGQTVNI